MIKANANKKNKGISLIVLIIIIVLILILASAVIFNLTKSNILESAEEAKFKQDIGVFKDELHLVISQEYLDNQGKRNETITALEYTKDGKKSLYIHI